MDQEKAYSKTEIFEMLKVNGLKQGSENWQDYVKAKRIVFNVRWDKNYHQKLQWITDYLNV